jgi:hypothetical protein
MGRILAIRLNDSEEEKWRGIFRESGYHKESQLAKERILHGRIESFNTPQYTERLELIVGKLINELNLIEELVADNSHALDAVRTLSEQADIALADVMRNHSL